jgi:hypothetical protein
MNVRYGTRSGRSGTPPWSGCRFAPGSAAVAQARAGHAAAAAAQLLNLSVATARTHLAHIFDKTHSQVELTRLLTRTMDGRPT